MVDDDSDVLVLYVSFHHQNTATVVDQMNEILEADLVNLLEQSCRVDLDQYELVGFGSGVYFGKHHEKLLDFVDDLSPAGGQKAFAFATSGGWKLPLVNNFDQPLKDKLAEKEFDLVDEFYCRGYDTYGPLEYIGGIQKGHPNESDLAAARKFAVDLKSRVGGA